MKRIAAVVAFVVLVLIVVAFFAITPIVRGRVREAAEKRALTIADGGVAYRFTRVELRDVTIAPAGSKLVTLRAPTLEARIHGMTPTWVILPRAEIAVTGDFHDVVKALRVVADADAKLPPAERLPIDVQDGAFKWKEPLGEGSSVSFSKLTATVRPAESLMKTSLKNGKIEVAGVSLSGITLDVSRSVAAGEKLDVRASVAGDEGDAVVEVHRQKSGTEVDLTVDKFSLAAASAKAKGLDLSSASADGSLRAERNEDGAVKSNGKLAVSRVKLPPIKVGPVALSIGGTVRFVWKASPKKGAPGVMTLDDASVEATVRGKTLVVKVRGEVSVGEDGEGPYTVKLEWDAGPFACAELAGDVAGPLGKGLAGAVTGNVQARGTVRGDVTDIDGLKHSIEILEGCKVDVAKGLGGMMNGLPF